MVLRAKCAPCHVDGVYHDARAGGRGVLSARPLDAHRMELIGQARGAPHP